jgi:hypothetical protein
LGTARGTTAQCHLFIHDTEWKKRATKITANSKLPTVHSIFLCKGNDVNHTTLNCSPVSEDISTKGTLHMDELI